MPDIDPSIPLGAKAPDPMQSLSGMLNIAKGVQGMQAQRLQMTGQDQQNQDNAISLGERKAMQTALSDPTQYLGQDGSIDWGKTVPLVMKSAPTTGMKIVGEMMNTQQAATNSKQLITNLDSSKRQMLGNIAQSLQGKDLGTINDTFDAIAKQSPELATAMPMIKQVMGHVDKMNGQKGIDAALGNLAQMGMSPTDQQSYNTPTGVQVNDNQHTFVANTKPGISTPQGAPIEGSGATIQPPVTTPVMGGPNGTTPGIMGPATTPAPGQYGAPPQAVNAAGHPAVSPMQQRASDTDRAAIYSQERQQLAQQLQQAQQSGDPAAVARAQQDQANLEKEIVSNKVQMPQQAQPKSGFIPTGMSPGQAGNMEDNVGLMNTHFSKLSGNASDAQTALGLTENIKALAAGAATGTYSGRKAFVAGLLNSMHLGGQMTGDLQKDTDLLEKNMAQLNLNTPASSDAGRALIAAARPHGTMGESSITESADQIAAQIKSNLAVRNYLTPYKFAGGGKGDAEGYQSARQQIETTADPRIWQLQGKSPAEQKAFMKGLTPSDQADLVKKSRALHSMGIIQ